MDKKYDAIALFSGGLDSILAVKMIEEQGLKVRCIHFITPFFGKEDMLDYWRETYELDIDGIDISADFANMLVTRPKHGFGKWLNPCVDCKILMLEKTHYYMQKYAVNCVISGEVIGQRPMSQRRDTLNIIRRDSGLDGLLLRPLSALLLEPTKAELSGLVDRTKLGSIAGRGRKDQLKLAQYYNVDPIPTPAGGCRLAEQENAARYAKAMQYCKTPDANDFILAHTGRQYWSKSTHNHVLGEHWICIGRDAKSNAMLERLIKPTDIIFKLRDYPGPLALGRTVEPWCKEMLKDAASFVASFAPRAVQSGVAVIVSVQQGDNMYELEILPCRETKGAWSEPLWKDVKKFVRGTDAIDAKAEQD